MPTRGTRAILTDAQVLAPEYGGDTRRARWEAGMQVNLAVAGPSQMNDPWLLVTDLPTSQVREHEYLRRTWAEELFCNSKGGAVTGSRADCGCRMVERVVLVLTCATIWMLALGIQILQHGLRPQVEAVATTL